ncbi:MAG: carboxypeptidase-like regulatory domain-containing protein [Gammaproteobacteria bacterium]|nr:carboxypeptidase-like regulatory domain-containing protein [Gammaproteobacteria bacterium]MDH3767453.1 carboxypeptidase-like regulatory domain-containing protein [Gammaproteobacteria bacterium]
MYRKRSIGSLMVLGALLGLAGCGSESSDSNGNSNEEQTPPPAQGESLTISGTVTDAPIPNATVMLTVDGQTFQAPLATDANGNYEVDIESSNPDAMVLMEAFDPNGIARFSALLDNFAGLQAEADVSGRVADMDITNITTAQYVLATRAASDGSIDNMDELGDTAALVDSTAMLELSAAIKLVVENIDGVTLPPEFADTQELAEAIVDGTTTFLDDVATSAPGALDQAIDLVVNDGNATIEWVQDRVPGVYLHREGTEIYAFSADGTGLASSYDRDAVIGFQWSVNDDGKLLVVYLTGSSEHDVVTLLSHTGNVLSIMVEEIGPGDEIVHEDTATVLRFPYADGFTNDNVPGSYTTIGEPGHLKVMLTDHTGYDLDLVTGVQSDMFFWEVSSDGTLYITSPTDGNTSQARVLGGADDGGMHLLVTEIGADGLADHMNVITVRRTDVIADTPDDVDAPDLTLAGNAYAFIDADQIDVFHFRADGAVRQIGQHTGANGVELVDRGGEWSMVDDQTIRIWLEGQDQAEDAHVISGLGTDQMLVQTPEDIAAGTERLATRIVPVEAADVPGAYYIVDENGSLHSEFVELSSDFTGQYMVDGVLDSVFDWSLDERGAIVISLHSDNSFSTETLTLRMLAGSSAGESMRFVAEWRANGLLVADPETGRAITVLEVLREG